MLAEINAGFTGIKSAYDLLKGLSAAKTQAAIDEIKIALQQRIVEAHQALLAAQEERSALLKRIDELEQEVVQLKDWETEKQRYELAEAAPGVYVRSLKPTMAGSEPPHPICADCYNRGEKSHLQSETRMTGRTKYLICHGCGAELLVKGLRPDEHKPRVVTGRRPR